MITNRFGALLLLFCLLALFAGQSAKAAPALIEVQSAGGIKAWLMPSKRLPLLTLSFAFRGGVEMDPEDKQGLAVLAASMLSQGAGPYDDEAFQKKCADLSVGLNFTAGRDAIIGQMQTLTRTKEEAFSLLALALTRPRLDPKIMERLRAQQLSSIHVQMADPDWQARYAVFAHLYGPHPYGQRSLGTVQTLASIGQRDVSHFLRTRLTKENLIIAVVGDITPEDLGRLLDLSFGTLPARRPQEKLAALPSSFEPTSILLSREGTQTNIFFAMPMMNRRDPDWLAAQIANYILGGGGFISRFMKTIREDKGLTYGISTSLASMDQGGLFVGQIAANNDKAGQAASLARSIWTDFHQKGPADSEIEAAKAYLTGSMPLALASSPAAASVLLSLQMDGFPRDYLDKREQLINKITRADILRVVHRWFDPNRATFAFVGKPDNLTTDQTNPLVTE